MALNQLIEFFSGNDVLLNYTVVDEAGVAKDLTGATAVIFVIAKVQGDPPLVSKSLGSGVVVTTPLQGKFTVTLVPADTEALKGLPKGKPYYHEARVTDAAGKKVTVTYGDLNLQDNSITT